MNVRHPVGVLSEVLVQSFYPTLSHTITKLQHKLFYHSKYDHSNAIFIPKFCRLSTRGN